MHFAGQNLNPSTFKYTWQGDWKPHVIYGRHDVVRHRGRTWYLNTDGLAKSNSRGYLYEPGKASEWVSHTNGNVNRGGWSPHRTYNIGDVVMYKGEWFVCRTSGKNIHPIYENGSLTNKWTKIAGSNRISTPNKFIPLFANENPLGWNRTESQNSRLSHAGGPGVWVVDWNGNPKHFGEGVGVAQYLGNQESTTAAHSTTYNHQNLRGMMPNYQLVDLIENAKYPITGGQVEVIQMIIQKRGGWFLLNNGEVYASGFNNFANLGVIDAATRTYGYQAVGKDWSADQWTASITNTFRDAFIVKLAGGGCAPDIESMSQPVFALDSDGYVWTWGSDARGTLGYGHPETGTNTVYGGDTGVPVRLPRSNFNGNSVVDIFSVFRVPTAEYMTFFALDSDGLLYSWGDNTEGQAGNGSENFTRRPNPVYDCSKFGGLKKFIGHDAFNPATTLLMNDGSLHYAGSRDSLAAGFFGATAGWESAVGNAYNFFQEIGSRYYAAFKGESGARDHVEHFRNVQDAYTLASGSSTGYPGIVLKGADCNLRAFGRTNTRMPVHDQVNFTDYDDVTDEQNYIAGTQPIIQMPMLLDYGSLNGQVEHFLSWGFAYNGSSISGTAALTQDGRLKATRMGTEVTNGDPFGMGDIAAPGGGSYWSQQARHTLYYMDENLGGSYGKPMTPRGGWQQFKNVHIGGMSVYVPDASGSAPGGGYVTVSEDGSAGFYTAGNFATLIADPRGASAAIGTAAHTETAQPVGRILAF